jgi:hypothetical protein
MPRQSTSLLTIGPRYLSPWADRAWRVSASAQLVSGSGAYWIVTPTLPAQHAVSQAEVSVSAPFPEAVVDSVLFLLAAHFGDNEVENYLVETHNVSLKGGTRELAPFYELADTTREYLASKMAGVVRLGFTRLDDLSLVDDEVITALLRYGFDVEVYDLTSTPEV